MDSTPTPPSTPTADSNYEALGAHPDEDNHSQEEESNA